MQHALAMWGNTRMIVLTAVCAAVYAATLIAFKTAIPLIPGITEVRIANIFPMAFGFLFGPAGAWGLAIGNVIGDLFGGTLSPASAAGFVGNFLLGYLPYTLWLSLFPFPKRYDWEPRRWTTWVVYAAATVLSSGGCAIVIAVVVDALGMVPYAALSKIITLNNGIGGAVGALFLLTVAETIRRQLGLFWPDIMGITVDRRVRMSVGAWLVVAGVVLGLAGGLIPGWTSAQMGWLAAALILVGCALM